VERDLYVKYGDWLARNWKNISFYDTAKIVVRETGDRIIATEDLVRSRNPPPMAVVMSSWLCRKKGCRFTA